MRTRKLRVEGRPLRDDDPPGTAVAVTLDDGSIWQTVTRSAPWIINERSNHKGIRLVLLQGKAGGYACERVGVRP